MHSGKNARPLFVLIMVILFFSMAGCSSQAQSSRFEGDPMALDEPYRPQFHFTPPAQWMNDPNGLVYYEGEYHLFYQHNPADTVWGPMHWGHAVSKDLVNWQHLPIALYPDDNGTIFSGSAVIDWQNTAGFGAEAMVAIFTQDNGSRQMQSLAYSTDKGRSWTKYEGNPVIKPPNNIKNFRDPKVFWYKDVDGGGHWVMAVSAGSIVLFYTSPDLKYWQSTGGFGLTQGATCGVWETPDLFELPVAGTDETRWVLAVAIGRCAPAGGSGIQYFVGDFDGQVFSNENDEDLELWADWGADFYAPQTWNDAPGSRRIWAAWMNNWNYAQDIPTSSWRGALTLPRELSLVETAEGIRLRQDAIAELESLRDEHWSWSNETVNSDSPNLLDEIQGEKLEIVAEIQAPSPPTADRFGFHLRTSAGQETAVGYVTKARTLFVDRSQSGAVDFNPSFNGIHTAPLSAVDGTIRLHLFVDRSSIEVFANDGLVSFTEQIFPAADSLGVDLFVEGGHITLNSLEIYSLDPIKIYQVQRTGENEDG